MKKITGLIIAIFALLITTSVYANELIKEEVSVNNEYRYIFNIEQYLKMSKSDDATLFDVATSGTTGDVLWNLNTSSGALVLTGHGKMEDYDDITLTPWYENRNLIKTIFIQDGVTNIGNGAFAVCQNLKTVYIPTSVTTLGSLSFGGCTSLSEIVLPQSITYIGGGAFTLCHSLKKISIPNISTIEPETFYNCEELSDISIPETVVSIGDSAFYNCTSLRSIELPENLETLGQFVFRGSGLRNIMIPDTVSEIGKNCFSSCEQLETISFSVKLTSIPEQCCYGCRALKEISIKANVDTIDNMAFSNCVSLHDIEIPNSVVRIRTEAFYGCTSLESVRLNDGISYIGQYAFYKCDRLSDINIPDSVATLSYGAFSDCISLEYIKLPKVISIGQWCFGGCNSLKKIVLSPNLKGIGSCAFLECFELREIDIPDSVSAIGSYAFSFCNSIKRVKLPSSMWQVQEYTFRACSALREITIPKSVKSIHEKAFVGIEIEKIYGYNNSFAEKYSTQNDIAFESIDDVSEFEYEIKDNEAIVKKYIGNGGNVIIPSTYNDCYVTQIEAYAFENSNIKSVSIPETIRLIGNNAFSNCSYLSRVEIPNTGIDFGYNVFDKSDQCNIYTISGSNAEKYANKEGIKTFAYEVELRAKSYETTPGYRTGTDISVEGLTENFAGFDCITFDIVYNSEQLEYVKDFHQSLINASSDYIVKCISTNDDEKGRYTFSLVSTQALSEYTSLLTILMEANEDLNFNSRCDMEFQNVKLYCSGREYCVKVENGCVCTMQYSRTDVAKLTIDSVEIEDMSSYEVNINISPLVSNAQFTTLNFSVIYDKNSLIYDGYRYGELLSDNSLYKSVSESDYGVIQLNIASGSGSITADGTLVSLKFSLNPLSSGITKTPIVFGTVSLSDENAASCFTQAYDGYATVKLSDNYEVPDVSTDDAVSVAETTCEVHGTINDVGGLPITKKEIVYYKNGDDVQMTVEVDDDFNITLENLAPGTEYRYQARAYNLKGCGYGNVKSFTTSATTSSDISINLNRTFLSLNKDKQYTIVATILPESSNDRDIIWSTEDSEVAEVNSQGVVTAKGIGETDIIAITSQNKMKAYCHVKVHEDTIKGKFDFSEINMATNSSNMSAEGFDYGINDGGQVLMATAYLARWDGVVLEDDDKYPQSGLVGDVIYRELGESYHVQDVMFLPSRKEITYDDGSTGFDNDDIKNAIANYGAVWTGFFVNDNCFSEDNKSYYMSKNISTYRGGHAVAIVGWDDNYSKYNFKDTPPGDGAFICKNSWGSDWGDEGYFYISYYDSHMGVENVNAVFYNLETNTNYNKQYQYDTYGATGSIDFGKKLYMANVFPQNGNGVTSDEILKAVSFYTYDKATQYEVYIVTDYKNSNSLKDKGNAIAAGELKYAGYHTIDIPNDIKIAKGSRFAVIVKLTASEGMVTAYIEAPIAGYSSKARANSDESYFSSNGRSWDDVTETYTNSNLCIKAFTDADNAVALLDNRNYERSVFESDKIWTADELVNKGVHLNKDFVGSYNSVEDAELMAISSSRPLGSLPAPLDFGDDGVKYSKGTIFNNSYKLNDNSIETDVKNQGEIGCCWTFAAYASLESSLMRKYVSEELDETNISTNNKVEAEKIDFKSSDVLMGVGKTEKLAVTVYPYGSYAGVSWISSDPNVAEVNTEGLVTAKSAGQSYVCAVSSNGEYMGICNVEVKSKIKAQTLNIVKREYNCNVGDRLLIEYNLLPLNSTEESVFWSSSNQTVATVNSSGVVTAKMDGISVITGRTAGWSILVML